MKKAKASGEEPPTSAVGLEKHPHRSHWNIASTETNGSTHSNTATNTSQSPGNRQRHQDEARDSQNKTGKVVQQEMSSTCTPTTR
jgi:hypothetical protein